MQNYQQWRYLQVYGSQFSDPLYKILFLMCNGAYKVYEKNISYEDLDNQEQHLRMNWRLQ